MSAKRSSKRKSGTGSWPVAYRWIAVGTVAVYTAVGSKIITAAQAQQTERPGPGAPDLQGLAVRRFDIAPGPLEKVLGPFEKVAGMEVIVPEERIRQIASPGVTGIYTAEEALRRILANTGVIYRITGPGNATLALKTVATTIEVASSMPALNESSPKYTEPLHDTPQTISVVPQAVMAEQGVATLRDALRNVAGISLAAGEGGAQGDNLTIRGFTARNDLFIDGMRDFGSYYRDPFNTQEVAVLQGPSSVTFGRGSTGGVVNQETKMPGLNHFLSGELDLGTDDSRRVAIDFDQPLGSHSAFRVNLMGDEGNVAGRDAALNRRFGVAPSLALGLGTPTRWTFTYFHQDADDIPDYGIPWLFNGPAPVDRTNYYGFKNANFLRTYDDIGTVKLEHDVNSHITLRNQVRYANYIRDAQITEPQVLNPSLSTPLASLMVNRNEISVNSTETYLDEQLDLTANFNTGLFKHTLVTGVEGGRETSDPTRPKYANVPATSLLDPDPNQAFTGYTVAVSSAVQTTSRSVAAYVLDTMKIARHWEVTGGFRWDRFATDYSQSVAPASAFSRVDEMPSWRAAVNYKPVSAGSIYFSAGTSFNPSAESLSLSASTANLPPEQNKTYEFGSKWDLAGGKLSLSGAVFRTEKTNAREPDPNNPLLNVLAGNQRVDGVQFGARGHVTSRWELLSSYAYLNGRVVSSQYYPAAIGAQLANVPRNTFNIWNTYRFPRHWTAGVGANFVSSRTASSTVPLDPTTGLVKEVPGYWIFSAMAEHPINEHVSLQANINNLANRYYYDEIHPAHIVLGAGRSAVIGFKFKF